MVVVDDFARRVVAAAAVLGLAAVHVSVAGGAHHSGGVLLEDPAVRGLLADGDGLVRHKDPERFAPSPVGAAQPRLAVGAAVDGDCPGGHAGDGSGAPVYAAAAESGVAGDQAESVADVEVAGVDRDGDLVRLRGVGHHVERLSSCGPCAYGAVCEHGAQGVGDTGDELVRGLPLGLGVGGGERVCMLVTAARHHLKGLGQLCLRLADDPLRGLLLSVPGLVLDPVDAAGVQLGAQGGDGVRLEAAGGGQPGRPGAVLVVVAALEHGGSRAGVLGLVVLGHGPDRRCGPGGVVAVPLLPRHGLGCLEGDIAGAVEALDAELAGGELGHRVAVAGAVEAGGGLGDRADGEPAYAGAAGKVAGLGAVAADGVDTEPAVHGDERNGELRHAHGSFLMSRSADRGLWSAPSPPAVRRSGGQREVEAGVLFGHLGPHDGLVPVPRHARRRFLAGCQVEIRLGLSR
uniref:Uncharacterized protein n=1 Tax=Streptomyces sp. F12 TaxID=1436084 RepID=V9Z7Y2_9ACTN|nr:hypothetical protein pFRL6_27 [Streptomyces sp. F12]